jgi:nucleotidyltransferase/DNA polymerase involved in DNA repair
MNHPLSAERMAAANRIAAEARKGVVQCDRPHATSRENKDFVPQFFQASRLHFIGSWRDRFEKLLSSLPPPPPLPKCPPGLERCILHIDMDCFFASVAKRGRPELDGIPVAVAWSSNERGAAEIASCTYEARAYGVRNGMWVARARELCDCLVVMPYEFEAYASTADAMYRSVFEATPHVMGVSVDECFADFTGLNNPREAAAILRQTIFARSGCTASVGMGPNRLLARLATKQAKPDGMHCVGLNEGRAMLGDLPVSELPGVGSSTVAKLDTIGVRLCRELLQVNATKLREVLGPGISQKLRSFAAGEDVRPWEPRPERKSVGAQSSWGVRFQTALEATTFVEKLSQEVGARLIAQGLRGVTVTLKVWRAVQGAPAWAQKGSMGHGICDHVSRSVTLALPTNEGARIAYESSKMLAELSIAASTIRGMGVNVSKFGVSVLSSSRKLPARVAPAQAAKRFSPEKLPMWWKPEACDVTTSASQASSFAVTDERASQITDSLTAQSTSAANDARILFVNSGAPSDMKRTKAARPSRDADSPGTTRRTAWLHPCLEAMKETLSLAFVSRFLSAGSLYAATTPHETPVALRNPGELLSLMSKQLLRSRWPNKDAIEAATELIEFARELGLNSLRESAKMRVPGQDRLIVDSLGISKWLDGVQECMEGISFVCAEFVPVENPRPAGQSPALIPHIDQ